MQKVEKKHRDSIWGIVIIGLINVAALIWLATTDPAQPENFLTKNTGVKVTIWTLLAIEALYFMVKNYWFFGQVIEGSVLTVMSGGQAWKFVGSIKGHKVGRKTGMVYTEAEFAVGTFKDETGADIPIPKEDKKPVWTPLGFFCVGVFPFQRVHRRNFMWNKINPKSSEFESRVDPHAIQLRHTYAYGIGVTQLSKDLVPLRIDVKLTLQTRDASKSLFATGDFLTEATAIVVAVVRDYVGGFNYEEIIESKDKTTAAPPTTGTDPAPKVYNEKDLCAEVTGGFAKFMFGQTVIPNGEKILRIVVTDQKNENYLAAKARMKQKQDARAAAEVAQTAIETATHEASQEEKRVIKAEHMAKQKEHEGKGLASIIQQEGAARAGAEKLLIEARVDGLKKGLPPETSVADQVAAMSVAESIGEGIGTAGVQTLVAGKQGFIPLLTVQASKKEENKEGE